MMKVQEMRPISTISITCDRYQELHEAEQTLTALRSAGVEEWEGYKDVLIPHHAPVQVEEE